MEYLIKQGYAVEKKSINDLEAGDIIAYDWRGNGIDHIVFYLGEFQIAGHSPSLFKKQWDYKQADKYYFLNITNLIPQKSIFKNKTLFDNNENLKNKKN